MGMEMYRIYEIHWLWRQNGAVVADGKVSFVAAEYLLLLDMVS